MLIKKTFTVSILILLYSLSTINGCALAAQRHISTHEQLITQVDVLSEKKPETLNYNNVVKLSNAIFLQRKVFPNETLAKTYLLLANVASNKGELDTAYQFIQDGLTITTRQKQIKLRLQIKLASILLAKKQYKQLLTTAQQAIDTQQENENTKYFLFALSYRSVAFAMLNKHKDALSDLQKVEDIIEQNPSFTEHISLLAILANAYYHLGDSQTALTMHLKILKLRFSSNTLEGVVQTYYHIANAYYRLKQFNDAYNAYWEAKRYAQKKAAYIYTAYASQGLGLTLIQQKQYIEAKAEILEAKSLFYQYNLAHPYLETTISLALINKLTEQQQTASKLLLEAEQLSINIEVTNDYIILYQLLADMYKDNQDMSKAYFWQLKYSAALLKARKSAIIHHQLSSVSASNQSRQLAVKLAEQGEIAASFSTKYNQQQTLIFILSAIALFLLSFVILLWFKNHVKNLKKAHESIEKPNDVIADPLQSKYLYEKSFNMARKYSYPLTIGYISISNWQDLTRQFNQKIVAEVSREIAIEINKHINEFENAGVINEGEYILLFPHQHKDEVTVLIEKLVSALKLRSFANLGDFSVIIVYSIESLDFQDIDPYIFLSQLSDSIKIA